MNLVFVYTLYYRTIALYGIIFKCSCAYSSGDRAPVSGTGCAGSNPARRTKLTASRNFEKPFLYVTIYIYYIEFL